jgi:hypothetical protein
MPYGPVESRPTQKVPIRIGDAERDRAIASLGDHFAAGRLTAEEFDQRTDQALQARFNADLEPLFVDLPRTAEPPVEPNPNRRPDLHLAWSAMLWLAPLFVIGAVVAAVVLSRALARVDVPLGVLDHRALSASPPLLRSTPLLRRVAE